jgi:hypothetical protein
MTGIGSLAASSYPSLYEFFLLFHETGVVRVHFCFVFGLGVLVGATGRV